MDVFQRFRHLPGTLAVSVGPPPFLFEPLLAVLQLTRQLPAVLLLVRKLGEILSQLRVTTFPFVARFQVVGLCPVHTGEHRVGLSQRRILTLSAVGNERIRHECPPWRRGRRCNGGRRTVEAHGAAWPHWDRAAGAFSLPTRSNSYTASGRFRRGGSGRKEPRQRPAWTYTRTVLAGAEMPCGLGESVIGPGYIRELDQSIEPVACHCRTVGRQPHQPEA